MKKRSVVGPALTPNPVRSASPCGSGRRSRWSSIGINSYCKLAKASSISDWTPPARTTRHRMRDRPRIPDFPTPGSPCTTSTRLSPARTASTSASSTSDSLRRTVSRTVETAAILPGADVTPCRQPGGLATRGCDPRPAGLSLKVWQRGNHDHESGRCTLPAVALNRRTTDARSARRHGRAAMGPQGGA
jgi:hypothetical protein